MSALVSILRPHSLWSTEGTQSTFYSWAFKNKSLGVQSYKVKASPVLMLLSVYSRWMASIKKSSSQSNHPYLKVHTEAIKWGSITRIRKAVHRLLNSWDWESKSGKITLACGHLRKLVEQHYRKGDQEQDTDQSPGLKCRETVFLSNGTSGELPRTTVTNYTCDAVHW